MSDTPPADNWLVAALWGVAGFAALTVGWILRRFAVNEDRDYLVRKEYADLLAQFPAKIEAMADKLENAEDEIRMLRADVQELKERRT